MSEEYNGLMFCVSFFSPPTPFLLYETHVLANFFFYLPYIFIYIPFPLYGQSWPQLDYTPSDGRSKENQKMQIVEAQFI